MTTYFLLDIVPAPTGLERNWSTNLGVMTEIHNHSVSTITKKNSIFQSALIVEMTLMRDGELLFN